MSNSRESSVRLEPRRFVTKRLEPLPSEHHESYSEFTVVGRYADSQTTFVRHVAMLANETKLPATSPVEVWHIGPPLVAGDESRATADAGGRTTEAQIVSDISLTIRERSLMKTWRSRIDKQDRERPIFRQYVVMPHMKWEKSEKGRKKYQRFSCVGFVMECYKAASVSVIDESAELPDVYEAELRKVYEEIFKLEQLSERARARYGFKDRDDLGIGRAEPWKIILPGYVFRALQRATFENPRPIPFVPTTITDASFP